MNPEPPLKTALTYPVFPSNSTESVNMIVHYYRAEVGRALSWRDRIDRTTNWAITLVAAILSISFSTQTNHHGILIFAMGLIVLILIIESRRYRFYDVYRNRCRRLERYYIAEAFAPSGSHREWSIAMADDLRKPCLSISLSQAMAHRLRRNYIWIFLVLLAAWLFKTVDLIVPSGTDMPDVFHSTAQWVKGVSLGPIPGSVVVMGIATFYAWLTYAMLPRFNLTGEFASEGVHV